MNYICEGTPPKRNYRNQPTNKPSYRNKPTKETYLRRETNLRKEVIIEGQSLLKKNKHIEVEPEVIKQNKNTLLSYICQDSNGNLPLNNDSSSTYMNYAQILKSYNPSGSNT